MTSDELNVKPNDQYDYFIRDNMVFAKKITISDVSYAIPRYNWVGGVVYDQYDDNYYGSYITNIDITDGGAGYNAATTYATAVGGGGSGVELTVNVNGGIVTSIGINSAGNNLPVFRILRFMIRLMAIQQMP